MIKKSSDSTPTHEAPEQRRRTRWKAFLPCRFHNGKEIFHALVLDLSPGGIFIKSEARPRLEEKLNIEIQLPSSDSIQLGGTVRYVGRFLCQDSNFRGFGLKFDRIRRTDLPKLKQLMDEADTSVDTKHVLEVQSPDYYFF